MDRIFYFMHIPWGWAKQRPQFLAEELSEIFITDVFFKRPYKIKNLSFEGAKLRLIQLLLIPGQTRFKLIRLINVFLLKAYFSLIIRKYKFIWLTSPELYPYLPKLQKGQILIYDCMDDMLSFPDIKSNKSLYSFYKLNEQQLFENASIIFSSSAYLKGVLQKRYSISKEIVVLNNAISDKLIGQINIVNSLFNSNSEYKKIVYVGTISHWMDWDLILASLNEFSNICYHFYGPIEFNEISHDRIIFHGPVAHNQVSSILSNADILVMPFVVNELIMSVNPVKLYEYIYTRKPVISVYYQESLYFDEFVYLYDSQIKYFGFIEKIVQNKLKAKGVDKDAIEFCTINTWRYRVKSIVEFIDRLNDS